MIKNVALLGHELIARDTMAFHFEKPDGFDFRAGQFGDITLADPPETDDEGNIRGFSLASAPFESDLVMATRLRDTAFKRVLRELPAGELVTLDAPYGDFTLHKNEATPAVFLIGGIGVTPIRSMVAQASHDGTGHRLLLIHANSAPENTPFRADFEGLAASHPNFRYVQTVSEPPQDWDGETGHIDEAMLRRHVEDLDAPLYYLSGPAAMVQAMRSMLVDASVDEDHIRTEEFTGY